MGYFKGLSLTLRNHIYHLLEQDFHVKNCKNQYKSGCLDFLMTPHGMKGNHLAVPLKAR